MRRACCIAFRIIIGLQCFPAHAERKPNTSHNAELVIWGTVEDVVRVETVESARFKVKIRIKNREHGYISSATLTKMGNRPIRGLLPRNLYYDKVIWASCFQRNPSAPRVAPVSIHKTVPHKGQFIRALLVKPRPGELEGINSDWFQELKLNADQLAAMRWVQTIGSSGLRCDDRLPGRPVAMAYFYKMWDSGVTDADMKHVTAFPELRSLELFYSQVGADGLKAVTKLKKLEELDLGHYRRVVTDQTIRPLAASETLRKLGLLNAGVTDQAMKQFAVMPSLRHLVLGGTKITDAGLEALSRHQHIKSLTLGGTGISDRGLKHLAKMKSLKRLGLEVTAITDEGLKTLTALSLTSLDLRGCRVSEAGLMHIAAHKELRQLNLQDTPTSDAVLEKLSLLKDLREITLQGTRVTDIGLLHLAASLKLEVIWIAKTRITADGVKQLNQALPKCRVTRLPIE